jgi:hypothetical protein
MNKIKENVEYLYQKEKVQYNEDEWLKKIENTLLKLTIFT